MIKQKRLAILEQPALRDNEISMLNLDEYSSIMSNPGVEHTIRRKLAASFDASIAATKPSNPDAYRHKV